MIPRCCCRELIQRSGRLAVNVLSVLGVTLLVLAGGVLSAAPQVLAAPQKEQSSGPLSAFGACLSGKGEGSLVLLMDQSGSLRQSDPEKARVKASKYLAQRLAAFADSSKVTLKVRVAGFASDYQALGDWVSINSGSLAEIDKQITAAGDNLKDYDTDYWTALEGARQDLAEHDSSECRSVAWFSDGAYDLDVRDSDQVQQEYGTTKSYAPGVSLTDESGVRAAEAAGKQDICRPTGLADQLRASHITLLGIGLSSGDSDFDFMKRITSGGGKNSVSHSVDSCGNVSDPPGEFYPVTDIDSLLMAFDSISAPGRPVSSSATKICQGDVCSEGETSFVLDRSLRNVHILASSDTQGLEANLYAPGSQTPIMMASGSSGPQSNQGVSYEWMTGRTLRIDLDSNSTGLWTGQWRLVFVDRQESSSGHEVRVNLHLSSPLSMAWKNLGQTTLRQGEAVSDADLKLVDGAGGHEVPPSDLTGPVSLNVSLKDAQGKEHNLFQSTDPASLSSPQRITIPKEAALGSGTLTTSLTVTTGDATAADGSPVKGTTLSPSLVSTAVSISPPSNYPTLGDQISFGRLDGRTTASANLKVTGPGCVWIGDGQTVLTGSPKEAGTVTIAAQASSKEKCVKLKEGQSGTVPVSLATQEYANGAVTGTVTVMVAPLDDQGEPQGVDVPFTADMRRPLNVGTAWTAFVIALLCGVAIPIGILYLFKYLSAVIPSGSLVVGTTVVEVPRDGTAPTIDLPSQRMRMYSLRGRTRTFEMDGYRLRTIIGLSPTAVPRVELVEPNAPSVSGATPGSREGRAVVPLGVRGQWIVVADQPSSPDGARRVTLIVLAASMDEAVLAKVVGDAQAHLASRAGSILSPGQDSEASSSQAEGHIGSPPAAGPSMPGAGTGFGSLDSDEDDAFGGFSTTSGVLSSETAQPKEKAAPERERSGPSSPEDPPVAFPTL